MFYILNAFSPTMLNNEGKVIFERVTDRDARAIFHDIKESGFLSAIGHESTAKLASALLYWQIDANRTEVKLKSGDRGLIFTLAFRPEEGRVYDYLEIINLAKDGKILIYYFKVE